MRAIVGVLALLVMGTLGWAAPAAPASATPTQEAHPMLAEGTPAPDFSAVTTDGKTVKLADFRGKRVVLYFYPKDDTPGCTREACNFRDTSAQFKELDTVVLGVSVDDQASHQKFTEKYSLPFPLIVDASKEICRKYGALNEERGVASRITYLIGKDGKIAKAYATVKPDEHAGELLAELKKQGS